MTQKELLIYALHGVDEELKRLREYIKHVKDGAESQDDIDAAIKLIHDRADIVTRLMEEEHTMKPETKTALRKAWEEIRKDLIENGNRSTEIDVLSRCYTLLHDGFSDSRLTMLKKSIEDYEFMTRYYDRARKT